MTDVIRALQIDAFGIPPQFSVVTRSADELLASVSAASDASAASAHASGSASADEIVDLIAAEVLPLDRQIANGFFPPTRPAPLQPGLSAVGRRRSDGAVVAVQGGAFALGFARPGTFATSFAAPAGALFAVPNGLDPLLVAAGLANQATARVALVDHAGLIAGETVLVLGARGGVGMAAVALALSLGAKVVGAVRDPAATDDATAALRATGAELRTADADSLRGLGAHVIVDNVGTDTLSAALGAGAARCRHVLVGVSGNPTASVLLPLFLVNEHRLMGFNLYALSAERRRSSTEEAMADLASGLHVPRIKGTFTFDQAAAAYGSVGGDRVLLIP
jgi:NADPH:quinone reductase